MENVLIVDSVQKSYSNKLVLSDIFLRCVSGEVIGLLGRNGSGKSTLLKIIFGIETADYKFVSVNGIKKDSTAQLLQDISYLSQDNFIPPHFPVKKAIALAVQKEQLDNFIDDVFLKPLLNNKVGELSGGELRYLEIKLILTNASKFCLLDEPYNGLSPIIIQKINDLIKQNSFKKGIIITDHNYHEIIKIADRMILLSNGATQFLNHIDQLVANGYLRHAEF